MMSMVRTAGVGLAIMVLTAPAQADVKTGVDAWSRGDYAAAVKEWRPTAIAGDADAQFNMGQAYKLGRGVSADLKIAEDWYRRAAEQGHLQASDNYGLILFQNGDRQRALPYIETSAARGEPRAQYVLGTALFNGDLVKKDWVRAYALMTRASAAGLAPASSSLAQMDRYIPLDQRQRGLVLARDLETKALKPAVPVETAARPAARPLPSPIRGEDLPPSQPAAPTPPVAAAVPPPIETVTNAVPPRASAAPAPRASTGPVATPGGRWRVQLGAFGDAGRARALFTSLEARVPSLGAFTPYLVKAGAVTRLQAGPLASKAAADRLCRDVAATGQACLVVAP